MEFLTSDEAEQYCIEKLQQYIGEEELKEVIRISESYNIESFEAEANRKLGDEYFYKYKYTEAIEYYNKVLDFYEKNNTKDKLPFLYNRIGACKYAELAYKEALIYFDKANIYAIMFNDIVTEINSIFNIAMCYYKLSWIDKALEYADVCIEKMRDEINSDKYIYAHIIKISCYSENNDYVKAFEVSRNLIDSMEEKKSVVAANIYNNMGIYSLEMNKLDEALLYFNMSEEIRREKDTYNLTHTLIDKAEIYIRKNLYAEAENILRQGIELACTNNDHEYALKGKKSLLQIYEATSYTDVIEELYISIIDLLKNKNPQELKKIYLQIADFYIKQGKLEKAAEYMELSHNL